MRLLSKVFKDNDVIVEDYSLLLDSIKKDEKKYLHLRNMPCDETAVKEDEILWQARLKAYKMIENAAECADKIIVSANQKVREETEQAQKKGYADGLAKGLAKGLAEGKEEALAQVRTALNELGGMLKTLEEEKGALLHKNESELKELVLLIVKKIIDTELAENDGLFLSIYKNAIEQYNEHEWIKVTVSDYEAQFATSAADLLLSMAKGAKDIKIEIDQAAPRGACVIETPLSIVDAGVDTQLSKLKEILATSELTL